MPTFKAQKIPRKEEKLEDLLASFCYHFPQYTYSQAKKMPYLRVMKMLRIAKKEHTKKMMDILNIMSAVHAGKKGAVKDLGSKFSDIINE